jgi:hypothetical protein
LTLLSCPFFLPLNGVGHGFLDILLCARGGFFVSCKACLVSLQTRGPLCGTHQYQPQLLASRVIPAF